MKKSLTAALIVAALSLSACGGGGDDRPSKSDLAKSLTSEDSVFGTTIPKESADCVAGVLVDSDLSDKTLKAMVEADKDYEGSKDDQKALAGLTTKFGKCVTK